MNYISQIESLVQIVKFTLTLSLDSQQHLSSSMSFIMTTCCVCLQLNFHRYTNLLEMGVTGLIQELLETCIYCVCVIGTICWHEVITCEHHVSLDQKMLFHLNSLTFLGQESYG